MEQNETAGEAFTPPRHNPAANPPGAPVAVLVCHGMGQQVRFETISLVAEAIRAEAAKEGCTTGPVEVHLTRANDEFLARAEISWTDARDRPHAVHVYEAYWAPLTEGRISYWDTVKFLVMSAGNGLRYSKLLRTATFGRWVFGAPKPMTIGRATFVAILGLLLFLLVQLALIAFASVEVARWMKHISTVQLPSAGGAGAWLAFLLSLLPAGTGTLFDLTRIGSGAWFRAFAWSSLFSKRFSFAISSSNTSAT